MTPKFLPCASQVVPQVGDLYEECIHVPTSPFGAGAISGVVHWWRVDSKWFALCDKCHVTYFTFGKVGVQPGPKRIKQPIEPAAGSN